MREIGEVVKEEGRYVTVRVNRYEACGSCHACSLGAEGRDHIELTVENTVGAKKGDMVHLDMNSPNLLFAAFIMYGIPLISMLFGICISYYGFAKESATVSAITGFVFVIISFILIRLNEKKIKSSSKFLPRIQDIVISQDEELKENSIIK